MDSDKLQFICTQFPATIKTLQADALPKWGKMDAQQMLEHLSSFFRISTGQLQYPLVSSAEQLPKLKAFLLSDKEFRENTKAPILPEEPYPHIHSSFEAAVQELENEIQLFYNQFSSGKITHMQHPVFGDLNFEEWVLLHYKHLIHHSRQFGII